VRRKLVALVACLLALGSLAVAAPRASAGFVYTSAELDVFNSSHTLINQVSVTEGAAVSGTLYEINVAGLADAFQFGNATSLSTGGSAAGPYFVTFGVVDNGGGNFRLAFSWDPAGNDPYGSFANNFFNYDNPPLQAQYVFDATMYLTPTLQGNGDTASFILNAQPMVQTAAPAPGALALLFSGGLSLTALRRLRRKPLA
jgi:hypothetical protein